MENYSLQQNEIVLFKGNVSFEDSPKPQFNVELILTNLNVVFTTRTKKFLQAEKIDVDICGVDTIKIYNDNVQVIRKGNRVEIYFLDNAKIMDFASKNEAKTFTDQIFKLLTGENKFVRNVLKVKKSITETTDALHIDIAKVAKTTVEVGVKTAVIIANVAETPNKVTKVIGNVANQYIATKNTNAPKLLPDNNQVERLAKLKELLDSEAITQEEYEKLKKEII
ncbi:MAG: SHOCT domain-containing protein [Clostridia bacterium]|nr:SHOCT domain-containing protein [Clostridia bacterium]